MFGHVFGHIHCDCNPEEVCGICGDGVTDATKGEQCDEGSYCDDRDGTTGTNCTGDPDVCSTKGIGDCRPRYMNGCTDTCQQDTSNICGDAVLEYVSSDCLSTNNFTGSACDLVYDCVHGEYCAAIENASGAVLPDFLCLDANEVDLCKTTSEVCDDGNNSQGDGCSASCEAEYCGDGYQDRNGPDDIR